MKMNWKMAGLSGTPRWQCMPGRPVRRACRRPELDVYGGELFGGQTHETGDFRKYA